MDAADMNIRGLEIPGTVIQRVRNLRLRLMIEIHPTTGVVYGSSYWSGRVRYPGQHASDALSTIRTSPVNSAMPTRSRIGAWVRFLPV
jgi:hypothetical protein